MFPENEPRFPAKEPYARAETLHPRKEPYIPAKEPYIPTKEPQTDLIVLAPLTHTAAPPPTHTHTGGTREATAIGRRL